MIDIREQLRRQIDLEDESRALGVSRYHARKLPWRVEAGTVSEEANLPPGQHLLKACVEPVAARINEFLAEVCSGKAGRRHNAADFLLLTDPEEIAYLTTRVMVNSSIAQRFQRHQFPGLADRHVQRRRRRQQPELPAAIAHAGPLSARSQASSPSPAAMPMRTASAVLFTPSFSSICAR